MRCTNVLQGQVYKCFIGAGRWGVMYCPFLPMDIGAGSRGTAIFFCQEPCACAENLGCGVSRFPSMLVGALAPNLGNGVSLDPNILVGAFAFAEGKGVEAGAIFLIDELGGGGACTLFTGLRGCGDIASPDSRALCNILVTGMIIGLPDGGGINGSFLPLATLGSCLPDAPLGTGLTAML